GADVTLNANGVSLTGGNTGQINDRGVDVASGVTGTFITGLANVSNLHGTTTGITVLGGVALSGTHVLNTATGILVNTASANAAITGSTVTNGSTGLSVTNSGQATLGTTSFTGMAAGISDFSGGTVTFIAGDSISNVTTGLVVDDVNSQGTTV